MYDWYIMYKTNEYTSGHYNHSYMKYYHIGVMLGFRVFRPFRLLNHDFVRSLSSSVEGMGADKIYELRTYTIKPDKLSDYLELFAKNITTRTAHSKLCGFWTTELGGTLSQVIHIWEYDSYEHRTAVRKALSEDKKWNTEFTPYSKPMIQQQENLIMKSASWYPMHEPDCRGGIYELRTYSFIPSKRQEMERLWAQMIPARIKYSSAIGIWFTEVGALSEVHSLWSYKNGDEREQIRKAAFEDEEVKTEALKVDEYLTGMKCKILMPTEFSPWK